MYDEGGSMSQVTTTACQIKLLKKKKIHKKSQSRKIEAVRRNTSLYRYNFLKYFIKILYYPII